MNFGTESCRVDQWESQGFAGLELAYTSHKLEDRELGLLKEFGDFLETLNHRTILPDSLGHPGGELISEQMVDVQFAGRARGQERIVDAVRGSHGLLDGIKILGGVLPTISGGRIGLDCSLARFQKLVHVQVE